MKSLRICMAIDYYYPVIGGSEIQAYRLSESLSNIGLKVCVITRKLPGLSQPQIRQKVKVYHLTIFLGGKLASFLFLSRVFLFLIRNSTKYNIIHCHLATSTALGCMWAGILTKTPVLIKLGCSGKAGDMQTSLATYLGRMKISILKNGPCHFVAPSQEIVQEMMDNGFSPQRIHLIPNGVDTQLFTPAIPEVKRHKKKALGIEGKHLALYIGRFEPHKGILLLIDAWLKLKGKSKNWKLLIIGSGILDESIKRRIREKKMHHEISVLEPVSPKDVKDYLQIGDLFIQPSKSEGLSNALLEAMSCGLPVIASKIRVHQDIIKAPLTGLLFNPEDVNDLVRCLEKALEDKNKRMAWGMNARNWVVENLDLSNVSMMYLNLYRKILKGV